MNRVQSTPSNLAGHPTFLGSSEISEVARSIISKRCCLKWWSSEGWLNIHLDIDYVNVKWILMNHIPQKAFFFLTRNRYCQLIHLRSNAFPHSFGSRVCGGGGGGGVDDTSIPKIELMTNLSIIGLMSLGQ